MSFARRGQRSAQHPGSVMDGWFDDLWIELFLRLLHPRRLPKNLLVFPDKTTTGTLDQIGVFHWNPQSPDPVDMLT